MMGVGLIRITPEEVMVGDVFIDVVTDREVWTATSGPRVGSHIVVVPVRYHPDGGLGQREWKRSKQPVLSIMRV